MNFADATKLMMKGKKLKNNKNLVPIFICRPYGFVFSNVNQKNEEDGQVISYSFNDYDLATSTWQVIEEKEEIEKEKEKEEKKEDLNFGEALEYLKKGKKLSRACWNNPNIYIYLKTTKDLNEIRVVTIQGFDCPYMPNHRELLEVDWKIVQ